MSSFLAAKRAATAGGPGGEARLPRGPIQAGPGLLPATYNTAQANQVRHLTVLYCVLYD